MCEFTTVFSSLYTGGGDQTHTYKHFLLSLPENEQFDEVLLSLRVVAAGGACTLLTQGTKGHIYLSHVGSNDAR